MIPELITSTINQTIGYNWSKVNLFVFEKTCWYIYIVTVIRGNVIYSFKFWGDEKDGYDNYHTEYKIIGEEK